MLHAHEGAWAGADLDGDPQPTIEAVERQQTVSSTGGFSEAAEPQQTGSSTVGLPDVGSRPPPANQQKPSACGSILSAQQPQTHTSLTRVARSSAPRTHIALTRVAR